MEVGAVRLGRPGRRDIAPDVVRSVRPTSMAGEQVLPVHSSLVGLFPDGLRRGEVIGVEGTAAVSSALALAAGPSAAGAWTVAVGLPGLGVGAAAALGVAPERLVVLVPARLDAAGWAAVFTAVVDGFDVAIVRPPAGVTPSLWRRLVPRLRERGGVLIGVELPVGWERSSTVRSGEVVWDGIGDGHGHLRARQVVLERTGRGAASRPRRATVLLPGRGGDASAVVDQLVDGRVVDLTRRVG